MSKRYGRNQKRRHRAEIARLMADEKRLKGIVADQRYEADRLESTIAGMIKTIESVCKYSVALPPKKQMIGGEELPDRLFVGVDHYDMPALLTHSGRNFSMAKKTRQIVNLYQLETLLKDNREKVGAAIHLVLSNGRRSAYMLSEDGLRFALEQGLVDHVAQEVAGELVAHLRRGL